MRQISNQKITITALFAAIICVVTMFVKIPIPATNGYIHPGDGFVILSGAILGPLAGAVASGIGGASADLFGGYVVYAPVTLVIKAAMAYVVGKLIEKVKANDGNVKVAMISGAIISALINVLGYFCFEWILYGKAAFVSVFWNLIQGASGIVIFFALYPAVKKIYLGRQ